MTEDETRNFLWESWRFVKQIFLSLFWLYWRSHFGFSTIRIKPQLWNFAKEAFKNIASMI